MLKSYFSFLKRPSGIYFILTLLPMLFSSAYAMDPLNSPSALTGTIDGTTVSLRWEPNNSGTEVTGYNIYRNNSYISTSLNNQWQGTVELNTQYGFSVVAFGGQPTQYSAPSEVLILPNSLMPTDVVAPPSNPSKPGEPAGSINGSSVSFSWTASTDDEAVLGYNIYQNNSYLTTVLEPNYTGAVNPSDSYQWYVVAFDASTNFSTKSSTLSLGGTGTADTNIAPSTPTNITGSVTGLNVSLNWQASTDDNQVAGYNIYRDGSYLTTVFESSFSGVAPDDSFYNYQVAAFDFDNNFTPLSSAATLTSETTSIDPLPNVDPVPNVDRLEEVPSTPTALTGTRSAPIGDTDNVLVELSWKASVDNVAVTGYNVYRNNNYEATVLGTSWSAQLNKNEVNSFFVVAFDESPNFSDQSNRISLPDNSNRAPVFEGFTDQLIRVGQQWSLIIRPVDNDGTVPGLLPGQLPAGMTNVDNFNGTRTIAWQPLQPAQGFHTIQMTAIDSADPSLRTVETITLTVILPDDLSTIPNPAPTIDAVDSYVVRAGDEVALRVKAVDANGTVPFLRVNNPPEGSTFDVHPEEERSRLLRFRTSESDIGTMELHFTAVDSLDPSLTVNYTATLTIVERSRFIRTGERLRVLAAERNFLFGYASLLEIDDQADFVLYKEIAAEEFNIVSTENSMKWGFINPEQGEYRFDGVDKISAFAIEKGMVLHGHPLIWYAVLPPWIQNSAIEERENIMLTFIDDVVSRYSEKVAIWDVVNEAFEDDGSFRDSVWFKAMGESYIDKAFRRARQNDANGVLLYNEYDIGISGAKSDATFRLVQRLVNDNVPIDGVGFQMHVDADFNQYDQVAANFQRIADLGLDVYVTELDVSIRHGQTEQQQADVFANVLSLCLLQPACKATQIWGFTDRYSWRKDLTPLIFDRNYQQKPAYGSIQSILETFNR